MAVIAVCVALVAAGAWMVVRWGGTREATPTGWRRRIGVPLAAGALAGVLAAGAGGRIVMRMLAATSPEAHGSLTEAGETIGEITLGGTLGFIVFSGLPAGLLSGALYALVRPVLPRGRAGGVALGALLLVLFATRIDPLRADNFDFALVGPDWLAVLAFSLLALFQGMLVAALAQRMWREAPATAPAGTPGPRALAAGRVAVAVVVLAALPGFAGAVADILSSG